MSAPGLTATVMPLNPVTGRAQTSARCLPGLAEEVEPNMALGSSGRVRGRTTTRDVPHGTISLHRKLPTSLLKPHVRFGGMPLPG